VKFVYNYKAEASNQKAAFLNDFIGAFWENVKFKDADLYKHYTEINRALADAIEKNILLAGASYHVDLSGPKLRPEYIQENLAGRLMNEVVKSDKIPIRCFEDLKSREEIYQCTIPIIFLKESK